MELEHLISHEALRSAILSGNDSEYDSDDIDYNTPLHMCYQINGEVLPEEAPRLTPLD